MSSPLALSDNQLAELRLTAAALPVEQRSALLELIAGYLELEGDLNDGAFKRALNFALSTLPSTDGVGVIG